MAQVPNLLDLFQNGRQDDRPKAKPVADAKAAAKKLSGPNAGSLLPIETAPASKGNTPVTKAKSAFQAKIDKSRAKLAAKETARAPEHTAPKTETPAAKAQPARKAEPAARADKPQGPAKPAHADHDDDRTPQADAKSDTDATRKASPKDADAQDAAAQGLDEKTVAAIKKGLKDLGIEVDDAQLNDPAFLNDMLRLLQSLPMQALPQDDETQADAVSEVTDGTDNAQAAPDADTEEMPQVQSQDDAAQAASDQTGKTREDAKPLSRKDLSRLLEGRIAGLQKAAAAQAGQVKVSAQAPAVTPKEWQGIQVRARSEGASPDQVPMADLDRLRVMQAANAQAGNAGNQTSKAATDFSIETDNAEPVAGIAANGTAETGKGSDASGDQDTQTDLFGGNADANAAEGVAPKDGAPIPKEAAGPQFHQTLEQARSIEHRAGVHAGAEPRFAAHDTAVLEQIAKKMAATAHKSGDTVSIQLSPENLGKVHVALEMKEGAMAARISVESDDVRKQVESNLDALKDALKDQGIKLQGLEVSVDQRHSSLFNPDGSNAESFFRRQGRGETGSASGNGVEPAPFESAPESDTGRRWGYNTMEYIG